MEKGLKFAFMLSLKELVLRRVTGILSNDFETLRPFGIDYLLENLINTPEDKVKYKISKLPLPESLRKKMIDKVRHFSLEIQKWTWKHQWMRISTGEIDIASKLFWTSAGTIDYKKTAEALSSSEALDVEARYKLACRHCLEDYIPLLWEKLAEDRKEYFLCGISVIPYLEFCWPHILKGEFSELDRLWRSARNLTSFNQWAFENWAREGNKLAAEYFFLKLTHEEREISVKRATLALLSRRPSAFYLRSLDNVLCYLLSLMTPEQRMETIKKRPVHLLLCFFMMPWQDLLVENARLIWPFLPTSGYDKLSMQILNVIELDCCHPKSFREFFIMSPIEFKKYFVLHESYDFLFEWFRTEDSDSIECIFRNLDVADRVAIVFNPKVLALFRRCEEIKRPMVEVCLREAKLSKEDRERLKKERPFLRRFIELLHESDAAAENEKKG